MIRDEIFWRHESSPYVVSELLDGTTLREQLNANGIAVRKSLDYALQIASGLAAPEETATQPMTVVLNSLSDLKR